MPALAGGRAGGGAVPGRLPVGGDRAAAGRRAGGGGQGPAAAAARSRLAGLRLAPVVGHADWESQNLRWDGGRPLAVHDWDSAVAQPEAVVAGLAAAVWPVAGGGPQLDRLAGEVAERAARAGLDLAGGA